MFSAYMVASPNKSGKRGRTTPESPEEAAFLERYEAAEFERPSVTVDVVLLTVRNGELFTLVVPRAEHPHKGRWALPGGFVRIHEPLEDAAFRVLRTKCSLENVYVEQLCTFGEPDRDPRMRVISIGYFALVDARRFDQSHASPRRSGQGTMARVVVPWEGEAGGPVTLVSAETGEPMPLAFDHEDILGAAVRRIRGKLDYSPIGFQLLPERFTLLALQEVHETVLGRKLNKDSFRRRMLASGELAATGEMQSGVDHRPAELYRFLRRSAV
ncbi:NrtR DNA-binding winged helix domain-containing protein [Pendulispora albinea]|uniref:NUDIX domain-containing protein n=1 Tax=Pendulispora albinea TaxID=2741071 RepID=A0ABZ2M0C1_9BACT